MEIEETERFDCDMIQRMQLERVKAILHYAVSNVPFYRESFAQEKLCVDDINTLDDLRRVPFLSKSKVLERGPDLVARESRCFTIQTRTSGTTGTPLTIRKNRSAVIREHAFITRQLLWAGHQPGDRTAWIRGDLIVPVRQTKPPFWRFDRVGKTLMMSSYHLSRISADTYVKALESFDPVSIQAYPSSVSFLARHLENREKKYQGRSLRSVITSSEALDDGQRRLVEESFGCRVFDWYGSTENVVAIGTCEKGSYHVIEDYGYVEAIDCGDEIKEIVGTGFNNFAMPFIRYRTGDGILFDADSRTCECGRKFRKVTKVLGRMDDYLKMRDGRRIGRISGIVRETKNVAEAQIVQMDFEQIEILIVPFGKFSDRDKEDLISAARRYLGDNMTITVSLVSTIPRAANGKYRTVVCKV